MNPCLKHLHTSLQDGCRFCVWLIYAGIIGLLVGIVAVAFHYGIHWATDIRLSHPTILWALPFTGAAIVFFYRVCGMEKDQGTNLVLVAVREAEPLKLRTAPLIFLSTVLTHLVGGSAGREGAALQLGSSLAAWIGKEIRLDAKDHRIMVMCGMSAAPIPKLTDRKNSRKMEQKGGNTMEQQKNKKGTASPRYDDAFKAGAIRMVTEQKRNPKEVAQDLGICIDTLRNWLKLSGIEMGQISRSNREQQRIRELEAELRSLRKQLNEKDEVIDILKKSVGILSKP